MACTCTRYLAALGLLVLVPSAVYSQTGDSLTVRVVDGVTSTPLQGAEVGLYIGESELFGTRMTGADGIAAFSFDPTTGVDVGAGAGMRMYRAYPNPFSRVAVTPFTLDRATTVSADVYDLLGARIASIEGAMEAGTHALRLDLPGLPAGTYVVRINVGGTLLGATTITHGGGGAAGPANLTLLRNTDLSAYAQPVLAAKLSMPGGAYTVRVHLEGYEAYEQAVTIDGHYDLRAELVPISIPATVAEFGTDETRRLTVIGTAAADGLEVPRDLEFHPDRPNELWTVNREFDGTVIFFDPGTAGQTSDKRIDVYGYHFMEEVSAMAMGAANTFATTQESENTYNDNYPGNFFMGPTLWPADLSIYARANQTNDLLGSHLDMQHESPLAMGIAHDQDNVYWVFDGYYGDIVRYDFGIDHTPGHDDHSDGIVRRYSEVRVKRVPDVPSHLVLDKKSGWLYINDTGNKRVLRVDTKSGVFGSDLQQIMEPLREYSQMKGVKFETLVSTGLNQPSGIELYKDRLFVTDHATGEIIAYSLAGEELGRIETGAEGIMGIAAGPDGKLWYVDGKANKLVRVDP